MLYRKHRQWRRHGEPIRYRPSAEIQRFWETHFHWFLEKQASGHLNLGDPIIFYRRSPNFHVIPISLEPEMTRSRGFRFSAGRLVSGTNRSKSVPKHLAARSWDSTHIRQTHNSRLRASYRCTRWFNKRPRHGVRARPSTARENVSHERVRNRAIKYKTDWINGRGHQRAHQQLSRSRADHSLFPASLSFGRSFMRVHVWLLPSLEPGARWSCRVVNRGRKWPLPFSERPFSGFSSARESSEK